MNEVYNEGKEAFNSWVLITECPYNKRTDNYNDWVTGWFDARDEHTAIIYGE